MALAWLRKALKGTSYDESAAPFKRQRDEMHPVSAGAPQEEYKDNDGAGGLHVKILGTRDEHLCSTPSSASVSTSGTGAGSGYVDFEDQRAAAKAARIEKHLVARLQRDRQLHQQLAKYFNLQRHVIVTAASFDMWTDVLAWRPMFDALAALCKHVTTATKQEADVVDVLTVLLVLLHAERFAMLISLDDLASIVQEIAAEDSAVNLSRGFSTRETGILMQQQQQQQQQQQPHHQQSAHAHGAEAAVRGAAASLSRWDKAKFFELFEAKVIEGEVRGDSVTIETLESMLAGMEPGIDSSFLAYATFTLFSTFAKSCKSFLTLNELAQLVNALDLAVTAQRSPRSVRS